MELSQKIKFLKIMTELLGYPEKFSQGVKVLGAKRGWDDEEGEFFKLEILVKGEMTKLLREVVPDVERSVEETKKFS